MKILHITNNYPYKSQPIFGIFVKEQIDSLTKLGIENDVFFINSRLLGKLQYIKCIPKLLILLLRNKYNIIHCHHIYSGIVLISSVYGIFFKKILSYQNPIDKEGKLYMYKIAHLFFENIILKIKNKGNERKITYLPNGVNLNLFKPYNKNESKNILQLDKDKKYVLFMDSYDKRKQKRLDRFNSVISIIKEKYKLNEIEPLILTNTERKLIPRYISACDVHLITSDFEGSPNSVKECLACDRPVVSTPVGDINALIGQIRGCYISKTFEKNELAGLVYKSILNQPYKCRNHIIDKNLDINKVAKNLTFLYKYIHEK